MGRLVIYRDSERLAEHDLSRGVIGLGRHPENDIVLDDRTLSRYHARIMRHGFGDEARWVVVDLGAQNGVHLNGERIADEVELHPGDRIELGRYTAVFEPSGPAKPKNGGPARPGRLADLEAPTSRDAGARPGALAAAGVLPSAGRSVHPAPNTPPERDDDILDLEDEAESGTEGNLLGDELDDLVAPTKRDPARAGGHSAGASGAPGHAAGAPGALVTHAQNHGLTADLASELARELADDSDEEAHADFVAPEPTFVLLLNGTEVSRHPLTATELTIGRSKQCDIVISLLGLSRKHARMVVTDEGVVVEDLGSQNGTWVNNARIDGRQVLKHGDLLNFYDYGVLFLEDGNVDVGFPGATPAAVNAGAAMPGLDDISARETARAPVAPGRPLSPPDAAPRPSPAAAPTARPAPAPLGPSTAPPQPAPPRPAPPRPAPPQPAPPRPAPEPADDDDDDLGLGVRASSLPEATEFGRQRPEASAGAGQAFDPDDLGAGSFLSEAFDETPPPPPRPAANRASPQRRQADDAAAVSQFGGDEDLEAELAFDVAARRAAADEFEDIHTNGELRELGDRTSAGVAAEALHGVGHWPTDAELERALAQTNDLAAVTVDVTMRGKSYAQIPLSQAVTRVGTDPRCECALAKASGLQPWHLTFLQMGGAVLVMRANRSGRVEIAGKAVDAATLRNGDIIRIGEVEMKIRFRR